MIAIDETLVRVASIASSWSPDAAQDLATEMAREPSARIDWDVVAGEDWLRVLQDRKVVALVCARLPLVIVQGVADRLELHRTDVSVVVVSSLDAAELSCSLDTLTATFGDISMFETLNPNKFSAHDLWFATV